MVKETLQLFSYVLFNGEKPVIKNWDIVLSDLVAHNIIPIACMNGRIFELDLPEDVKRFFYNVSVRQMMEYSRTMTVQQELTELLEKEGITPIIIKGASTARYYPDPVLRNYGDIDFYIRDEEQFRRAELILHENGYIFANAKEQMLGIDLERHYMFVRDDIPCEMHMNFTVKKNETELQLENELLSAATIRMETDGYSFVTYPDEYTGLILLYHLKHHFNGRGIKMKQLLDWLCFAQCMSEKEDFVSKFMEKAGIFGLSKLAMCLSRIGEMYFGMRLDKFSDGSDDKVTTDLAEMIFEGNETEQADVSADRKIADFVRTGSFFSRLQKGGLLQWRACLEYKWLRPFAWLWQIKHILHDLLVQKETFEEIRQGLYKADHIRTLAEILELE